MTINDSGLKPLILRAKRAILCHLGLKARCYSMSFVITLRAVLSVSKDSKVSKVLRDARQD